MNNHNVTSALWFFKVLQSLNQTYLPVFYTPKLFGFDNYTILASLIIILCYNFPKMISRTFFLFLICEDGDAAAEDWMGETAHHTKIKKYNLILIETRSRRFENRQTNPYNVIVRQINTFLREQNQFAPMTSKFASRFIVEQVKNRGFEGQGIILKIILW